LIWATSTLTAQAQANVEVAQINLGYTTISAPFDGVVTNHLQDVGALVGYSGPTKLASIVQIDPIYTYFSVNERQVLLIKEALTKQGRTLRDVHNIPVEIGLAVDEDYPYKGTIDYIAPEVDQNIARRLAITSAILRSACGSGSTSIWATAPSGSTRATKPGGWRTPPRWSPASTTRRSRR